MARLTDLSDEQDILDAFRLALDKVGGDAVKALHRNARRAVATLVILFEAEKFATTGRVVRRLGTISSKWRSRKLSLGFSGERGHFTRALANAIKSPAAVVRDPKGFTYDIRLPAKIAKVRGRAKSPGRSRRKARSTPLRQYLRFYEEKKAPGLGTIPPAGIAILNTAVQKATATRLASIRKAARRPGREFEIDIELELGGLTI